MKCLRVVPGPVVVSDERGEAGVERRSVERRCDDLAERAAAGRGIWVIAVLGLWLTADMWPRDRAATNIGAALSTALPVAWLGLTLAGFALRSWLSSFVAWQRCGGWRAWQMIAYLNLAMPVLLPWLTLAQLDANGPGAAAGPADLAAFPVWPLAIVAACLAALPMQPGLGQLAALGLMSAGAAVLSVGGPVAVAGLSAVAAVAGWLASLAVGRRWRADSRGIIETADRLRVVTAERNLARRADEDKRRFVAAASHDLRQPMHALGLFAATLERHLQGSADEPLARNMIRSVEALDRSFGALLDLSRLEAGTVQPHVQHFPMRDLFRRLHMQFAGQAEEAGLGLRFSAGGKTVNSDPQLLERVLANLIQNALRYTRHGGVAVVVRSAAQQIKLEVWDSGCGIDEADLPRVFDEFYRVPGTVRDNTQGLGMGLGLAIVKQLVTLLGHTLEIRSQPGRGTLFRIGIATGSLAEVEDATAAADTIPAPFLEARCVLLVDDEAPIREGLLMLLTEWGFEAFTAADLVDVRHIAAVLGSRLDLVISDLHLHNGEDGLTVIECVREICARPVPAFLITGDTSPAEIRRVSASGHMVLFKPVQPSKLFGVLRSLV